MMTILPATAGAYALRGFATAALLIASGYAAGKKEFGLFFVVCDMDLFKKEYYLLEPELMRGEAKLSFEMAKELSEIVPEEKINP